MTGTAVERNARIVRKDFLVSRPDGREALRERY